MLTTRQLLEAQALQRRGLMRRPPTRDARLRNSNLMQIYETAQQHASLQMQRAIQSGNVGALQALYNSRRSGQAINIREGASASDFPMLLGNLMYRQLMGWFNYVPQDWREYTRIVDTQDYRPRTIVLGAESENLRFVGQNGIYRDSKLFDRYFQVQVTKFGLLFRVNRTVFINDDLGYLQAQPERMGRAAARTLSTYVPQSILEANPNCFDGQPLFSTAHVAGSGTYSNLASGAGSALSMTALTTGASSMMIAKSFDGVLRPTDPSILVVPAVLKFSAWNILHSTSVVAAGGANLALTPANNPAMYLNQPLLPVVDRYLTNTTAWYMFADPNEIPTVVIAFLRGNQRPGLFVQNPQTYSVAGGDDPFTLDFDDLTYKVRYEFGGATGLWLGGYKAAGI